ncbi:MAG: RluA family pseudouridine synthase [Alphaproteobacteria bacterium]|nr:RluA family pseudouridine synthase [Alphaproteobacteria bacterium]
MDNPIKEGAGTLTVTGTEGGVRLDKWLSIRIAELSRSRIQALLAAGHVQQRGRTIDDASYRVKPGDVFSITIPAVTDAVPEPEAIPLTVIYEDSELIVIDKPAGLVVHPAAGNWQGTLVHALLSHCGDSLSGIGGVRRPGIVHRLDKLTSGLLVAAKTDRAHASLAEQFAAHTVQRRYLAFVWGAPNPARGRIVTQIGRSPSNRQKMAVRPQGGREAITNYETLQRFGDPSKPLISLIRCRLETGRTHQIRVHMAHIGHAIVGDPVYGGGRSRAKGLHDTVQQAVTGLGRQALHAASLGFVHPQNGQFHNYDSPLPDDMAVLLGTLEQI